jgi:hypothetical protein
MVQQNDAIGLVFIVVDDDVGAAIVEGLDDFCGLRAITAATRATEPVGRAPDTRFHLSGFAVRYINSGCSPAKLVPNAITRKQPRRDIFMTRPQAYVHGLPMLGASAHLNGCLMLALCLMWCSIEKLGTKSGLTRV